MTIFRSILAAVLAVALTIGQGLARSGLAVPGVGQPIGGGAALVVPPSVFSGLDLVVIGDSITTAVDATNSNKVAGVDPTYLSVSQTWPEVLKGIIQAKQGVSVTLQRIAISGKSYTYNYGSGQTLNQMVQDGTIGINALIPSGRRAAAKIVIFAGTNGIELASNSGATEYAGLTTQLDYLTGQGYTAANISVVTMLPRSSGSETARLAFNALIKGDAGARGYKQIRVDESLGFNDADDNAEYLYFHNWPTDTSTKDQIHPGRLGHRVIGHFAYDGGHYAGGVYPAATFNPATDLPNSLVFDGADYNATTGNWTSKTGSSVSVTLAQATSGNRPAAGTLNGLPAVEWSGASKWLRATSTGYAVGGVFLNSAVAFHSDVNPASNSFIYNWGDSVSGWDTGSALASPGGGWNNRTLTDTTNPHVLEAIHTGSNPNQLSFVDDLWQQTTDNHPVTVTSATSYTDLTVGGANQYQDNFGKLDGRMGELIFWKPSEPNDYWMHRVQRYLKAKYATP